MDSVGFRAKSEKASASVEWSELKMGDKAEAFPLESAASVSAQFSGLFGEDCRMGMEGSNDGKNFVLIKICHEPSIISLEDMVKFVRPVMLSGDGESSIDCNLFINRRA